MRSIKFLAVALALASVLEAQTGAREYALTRGRRVAKNDLVQAIQDCDKKVLRVPCPEIVNMAAELFAPDVGKTPLDFANFLSGLDPKLCEPGTRFISTEWSTQRKFLFVADHVTECVRDEIWLWDTTGTKRPIISLYDGHMIQSFIPVATKQLASVPALPETTQAGRPKVPAAKVDTPTTPRRMTRSDPVYLKTGGKDREVPVPQPGPQGPQGAPGLSCWDLNGNGTADLLSEDANLDGVVNISDCRGLQGPPGERGQPGMPGVPTIRERGFNPWPWVIGALVLGGGVAAYCHFEGCGDEIHNTNINKNGMVSPGIRMAVPLQFRR